MNLPKFNQMSYWVQIQVLQNHNQALHTCKDLIKENRLLPALQILTLLEKNVNALL